MSGLYPGIINLAINTTEWKLVNVPSTVDIWSSFKAKTRDNSIFYISDSALGTSYQSILVAFEDIVDKGVGNPLFYVKGSSVTILEVLLKY